MTLNIKYFLKNIILNPVEGYREALEDYKKDQKYKNLEHPHKNLDMWTAEIWHNSY